MKRAQSADRGRRPDARRARVRSLAATSASSEPGATFESSRSATDPRSAAELRSCSLGADERADFLPDAARNHIKRTLREDDDPDAQLARYVVETSDRDYFRAFSAWTTTRCPAGIATAAMVRSTIRARANRAWSAAGLDPLTPHEARHTCTSYLAAAGLTHKEVQTAMGHADIRTTLNTYAKAVPGLESGALAKVDSYIERAKVARKSVAGASGP